MELNPTLINFSLKRNYPRKQSFTLIEVLVAMSVLSVSLAAIFGTFRICSDTAAHSRLLTRAVIIAEGHMVEVSLKEADSFETLTGTEGRFKWTVIIAPTPVEGLGAVCVKVTWLEQQRTRQYCLYSTVRMRVLEG